MSSRTLPVFLFLAASTLLAKDRVDPIYKDGSGLAIRGFDPVAYFTQSKPVKGSAGLGYSWMGATWRFSSEANRTAFMADPMKYAPQFGGYCSWAVSKGYTAEIDPEAWRIIDGKLYLNYSKDIQRQWAEDVEKRIADANRNWPTLHN